MTATVPGRLAMPARPHALAHGGSALTALGYMETRMSDDCLFCRIARHEIPAHVVHEDDELLAFLDLHPVRPGHVLIIPRAHHDYFEDLPADLAARSLALGQRLARGMKRLYGVPRVAFAYTGIHVAHAHAHVIPMHDPQDITSTQYIEQRELTFVMPPQADAAELAHTARALREIADTPA